jgi:excisionase family DNA binding protein
MEDLIPCESADPIVLSVEEACHLLHIGRTTFYELMHAEKLVARKIRGRTVVLPSELKRFLETMAPVGGAS